MSTVNQIINAKNANKFIKYIDYIRYPKYKNLLKDTRINFEFPITVFVGKNGSGKSSVLKSVYGCVEGKNISDYWFSTKIDPIDEGEGDRNCFIYNYPSNEAESKYEVLIQRAPRKGYPDYWETSKPVAKYGMKLKPDDKNYRKPKLKSSVHYIDFHAVMSAFDKYRYFLNNENISVSNNYLRRKTKFLVDAIAKNTIIKQGNPKVSQNEFPISLSKNELTEISKILGKNYASAKIIKHKFFKLWGYSTVFNNKRVTYSDAFAGSGENAVVILVREILAAKNNSIILLDEPETCLHPGAQKNIFKFLLDQCLRKKIQIIISTHSKEFLKDLPNYAIKVFNELPDGSIEILNEYNPKNAFYYIGEEVEDKKTIIVEDKLSQELLISVALEMSNTNMNLINVQFHAGGAKEIKKSIATYSKLDEKNKFIIFDGDELIDSNGSLLEICDSKHITLGNRNVEYLSEKIKSQIQMNDLSFFSFNSNEKDQNKIDYYIKYLDFFHNFVYFLPSKTPEEIIWSDDYFTKLPNIDDECKKKVILSDNFKEKFRLCSLYLFRNDNSENIFQTQKMFITSWLLNKNHQYEQVTNILKDILSK